LSVTYDHGEAEAHADGVTLANYFIHAKTASSSSDVKSGLRIWISSGLTEHPQGFRFKKLRPYDTAIADIEVGVKQISNNPAAITTFELSREEVALSKGTKLLRQIFKILQSDVPDIVFSELAAIPLLGSIAAAIWKLIRDKPQDSTKGDNEVKVKHFKPWTFQEWHLQPVSIAEAFIVGQEGGQNREFKPTLAGMHQYELTVKARTGHVRFWRVDTQGDIICRAKYFTQWM
jgi:hypothetical protein